jgi:hypothetical protein
MFIHSNDWTGTRLKRERKYVDGPMLKQTLGFASLQAVIAVLAAAALGMSTSQSGGYFG